MRQNKKIRQNPAHNVHNNTPQKRSQPRNTICQPNDTYKHPERSTTAPPPDSHQAYKTTKKVHKERPAKNKEHEKHRQKSEHDIFDHTQNQCKTCPKTKKIMDPANPSEKHKKSNTKLFHTLEKVAQYHIRAKLKLHYHGQNLEKLVSRCPCNTKHHTSERHKYFEKIPQHIDRNIENMVNMKNDHSTLYNKTCL